MEMNESGNRGNFTGRSDNDDDALTLNISNISTNGSSWATTSSVQTATPLGQVTYDSLQNAINQGNSNRSHGGGGGRVSKEERLKEIAEETKDASALKRMFTNIDKALNINQPNAVEAIDTYLAQNQIYTDAGANYVNKKVSAYTNSFTVKSLQGIEAIPYQFLDTVDRRMPVSLQGGTNNSSYGGLGRKYSEKILTQIPLLFLAPCNPTFMADKDWKKSDSSVITNALLDGLRDDSNVESLLAGSGRMYSASYAYNQYYSYLNAMLTAVSVFLGLGEREIELPGSGNVLLKNANWEKETNTSFSEAYLAKQNLIFYMDSIDTIHESFSNGTKGSMIAGIVNGTSDTAQELSFLFGSGNDSLAGSLKESITGVANSIGESVLGNLATNVGGALVGSLTDSIGSIVDGGKIVFPEMWSDSSFDRSYSIDIKLRSPDSDSMSIFMNVLKPYCKILALTLPHMIGDNVNAYRTPFLVKAYCKGLFNIDLGMITGLSVTKGATCCWNDDGLPTQIDLSIDIKDLYSSLSMTGYVDDSADSSNIFSRINVVGKSLSQTANIVNNTAYMDFLANMAGLNINEMVWSRKVRMYYDLFKNQTHNIFEEQITSVVNNNIMNLIARAYSY